MTEYYVVYDYNKFERVTDAGVKACYHNNALFNLYPPIPPDRNPLGVFMETLISILVALLGGLGFLFYNERKKNISLKADVDLTAQEERSKITDEEVKSAEDEIQEIDKKIDRPVSEGGEYWKDYTKK